MSEIQEGGELESAESLTQIRNGLYNETGTEIDHARREDLRLPHELKNRMVTIKTFAQLLTDHRYQAVNFRARVQYLARKKTSRAQPQQYDSRLFGHRKGPFKDGVSDCLN